MITQVQEFISHHKLFSKQSKILVGLSGGPDSMVLIHVLMQLGYNCIAAHCNFHLRDKDSDSDAAFVTKWCSENNIPFFLNNFDTNKYAASNKLSVEMAARELRYNWFNQLRIEQNADVIGIAHHKDDSVETILINLIRGTGIKGLTGIPLVNEHIVRPLLAVSRKQIIDYLSDNQLPYVTDHTNQEEIYTRNILRLKVLPILENINPSVKSSIITTANNLKEAEKIYNGYISNAINAILNDKLIDIEKLKQTYSPQSVLFEILFPMGFTSSVIEDISNNLDSIPGKMYHAESFRLIKDRDYLIISENKPDKTVDKEKEYFIHINSIDKELPLNLTVSSESYTPEFVINKSNSVLQCDFDKLSFPLTLRRWKEGDWFIPFGMKGKKKISDFFSDNKFTLFQKEETWILLSDNKIVWIVNHRADNRFKITETTKTVYTITLS